MDWSYSVRVLHRFESCEQDMANQHGFLCLAETKLVLAEMSLAADVHWLGARYSRGERLKRWWNALLKLA